jgi:hypothetical protein
MEVRGVRLCVLGREAGAVGRVDLDEKKKISRRYRIICGGMLIGVGGLLRRSLLGSLVGRCT